MRINPASGKGRSPAGCSWEATRPMRSPIQASLVTQDQRNSLRARVRFQAPRHAWLAMGAQYGSGLPADIGNSRISDLLAAFGPQILNQVDLARSRVRPNFS